MNHINMPTFEVLPKFFQQLMDDFTTQTLYRCEGYEFLTEEEQGLYVRLHEMVLAGLPFKVKLVWQLPQALYVEEIEIRAPEFSAESDANSLPVSAESK